MAEKVKITGVAIGTESSAPNFDIDLSLDITLRDLFAAFALNAVVGLDLEDASHKTDAIYAYAAADAMLEVRQAVAARKGME